MNVLNPVISRVSDFIAAKEDQGLVRKYSAETAVSWPSAGPRNIVLSPDLGMELGHPDDASVSFLAWTSTEEMVDGNTITLVGPDIQEAGSRRLPFGKIVLLDVVGFDEHNAGERNRELHLAKFDISLDGFMVKAASQYMAEWCRISKTAMGNGFSLKTLGSAIICEYLKLPFVRAAEVIFVTSSIRDVQALFGLGNLAVRTVSAMSKMTSEMSLDCSECEYQDLCNEADELKALRNELRRREYE